MLSIFREPASGPPPRAESRTGRRQDRPTTRPVDYRTGRLRNPSVERDLEREPNARRRLVAVVGLPAGVYSVEDFGRVQSVAREQPGAHEVEGDVRREAPGEPEIDLGPEE